MQPSAGIFFFSSLVRSVRKNKQLFKLRTVTPTAQVHDSGNLRDHSDDDSIKKKVEKRLMNEHGVLTTT